MRLDIPLLRKLAVPPLQRAACGGRETNAAAALLPAPSTVPTPRMKMSDYMSTFRY